MEPPGEEDRGAQEGAPREELYVGPSDIINTTGSGFSRAGSISTTFDTTQQIGGATGNANAASSWRDSRRQSGVEESTAVRDDVSDNLEMLGARAAFVDFNGDTPYIFKNDQDYEVALRYYSYVKNKAPPRSRWQSKGAYSSVIMVSPIRVAHFLRSRARSPRGFAASLRVGCGGSGLARAWRERQKMLYTAW
jgi:hypothetical protein